MTVYQQGVDLAQLLGTNDAVRAVSNINKAADRQTSDGLRALGMTANTEPLESRKMTGLSNTFYNNATDRPTAPMPAAVAAFVPGLPKNV